jgi:hypothetical protein
MGGNAMHTYSMHEYVCIALPVILTVISLRICQMRSVLIKNSQ